MKHRKQVKVYLWALALSIGLNLAPVTATELSGDGMGEVLIFPFFIADNGWDTYINVQAASRHCNEDSHDSFATPIIIVRFSSPDG